MVLLCVRVTQSGLCEKLCHLHYCDFRHSLNVISSSFLDTQRNEFPINLGIFNINYFWPKLLENYCILVFSNNGDYPDGNIRISPGGFIITTPTKPTQMYVCMYVSTLPVAVLTIGRASCVGYIHCIMCNLFSY